jgi:amino acid transporter
VSAAHANEVRNPQRNYPIAILCAAVLMVFLNIVGAMSVGVVVPHDEINLAAGVMEAFRAFFDKFNLLWLLPIVAGLTAFGAMGQVSTWIVGPVKGLLSTADNGDLPSVFQKVNKNGIPVRLLVVQASLVTFFGLLFAVIPGVNEAFMMLLNVLIMLYCCMYILMFLSVLRLRYSEPDVKRAYKMPFGTIGVWLINCVGIAASVFVLFIGFFPPSQLDISSAGIYRLFIAVSLVVLLAIPFIIFALKKPTWKKEVQNAK